MAVTTYANAVDNVHTVVYNILKGDATIATYTTNIFDGYPTNLQRGVGFPHIIVNSPNTEDKIITIDNGVYTVDSELVVHVIDRQEGTVREIAGAVRNALKSAKSTTETANQYFFKTRGVPGDTTLPGEPDRHIWFYDIYVRYVSSA